MASVTVPYVGVTVEGLEEEFVGELREKLGLPAASVRVVSHGVVRFDASCAPERLCVLRGVERVCAAVGEARDMPHDEEGASETVRRHMREWSNGWARAEAVLRAFREAEGAPLPEKPTFRATVRRKGKHAWRSPFLQGHLGAAAIEASGGWPVELREQQAQVYADVVPRADLRAASDARLAAARERALAEVEEEREARGWTDAEVELERKRRTRAAAKKEREATATATAPSELLVGLELFGPERARHRNRDTSTGYEPVTALAPPLAYLLGRVVSPRAGETVLDPMCGVATTLIEAAAEQPGARYVGVDLSEESVAQGRLNAAAAVAAAGGGAPLPVQLHVADARQMTPEPVPPASVDCVLTDPPFGHRHLTFSQVSSLYPLVLRQMVIAMRPGARAAVLTSQRKIMTRAVDAEREHLELVRERPVVVGGMDAFVFVLRRTGSAAPGPMTELVVRKQAEERQRRGWGRKRKAAEENDK